MAKTNKKGNYRKENGRFDIYAMVNDIIIKEMENGIIPWHRPWTGVRGGAYSRRDGRPYSLINQLLLGEPGEYLTYKQLMEENGKLKENAVSRILIFWKQQEVEKTNANGEKKVESFPILRYYRVYHVDQCEGIEPRWKPEELPGFTPIQNADAVVSSYLQRTSCCLEHRRQDNASYFPTSDRISMPLQEQFPVSEEYYSTLYHEIAHSTGHPKRLARFETAHRFGSEPYGREELVAELTAASMLHAVGIDTETTTRNNAAYLQNWMNALKADAKILFWAASRADKVMNLVLNEETAEEEHEATTPVESIPELTVDPDTDVSESPAVETGDIVATTIDRKTPQSLIRFAKACRRALISSRPVIAGAFIRDGKQYITDGIMAVSIKNPYDDLPVADENGMDIEPLIAAARIGDTLSLPPYHQIRQQYKAARGSRKKYPQLTELDGMYFDTQRLIHAMELAEFRSGTAIRTKAFHPIYLQGEGIEVILMPQRLLDGNTMPIWRPDLKEVA